jgi:hypothetical protein
MKIRILFTILILVLALLIISSCATLPKLPNTENFDLRKREIKSIAILPLVIGDEKGAFYGKPKEVKAFTVYWQQEFNKAFKTQIKLIDDIEVKYWGEDFDITVPNNADYGKIMDELGVDAVICFSLIQYEERRAGEKTLGVVSDILLGTQETRTCHASFILHCYYLHQEDWAPTVVCETFATLLDSVESQRAGFMYDLLAWMDKNWPLSINYVQREKA